MGEGIDDVLSFVKKTNLPQTFVYGMYKIRFYYTLDNEIFGCLIFLIELLRP